METGKRRITRTNLEPSSTFVFIGICEKEYQPMLSNDLFADFTDAQFAVYIIKKSVNLLVVLIIGISALQALLREFNMLFSIMAI